jgi:hypothetical protein
MADKADRSRAVAQGELHHLLHRHIRQLMVYALALSRRTGLRLYDFVCAWFDEHHYYEFYPLHVVHKRRRYSGPFVRTGAK